MMKSKQTSSSTSLFLSMVVFLLGFLAATSIAQAINRSKDQHPNRTDRRHRSRNSTPTPHYLMCPVVVCPEISADCRTVEYLVMEFDDSRSGQVISCQSCNYCLDLPSLPSRSRHRRDLLEMILYNAINSRVSCPSVPDSCTDVRMTKTYVNGDQSTAPSSSSSVTRHCPACFDRTLVKHRHRHAAALAAARRTMPL